MVELLHKKICGLDMSLKDHFDINATPIQNFDDLVNDAVLSVDEKTADLNLKRHNLTIKGKAEDAGLMETNSTTEVKNKLAENGAKEKRARVFHIMIAQLEQARLDAENLRNLIDLKLEELDTNINRATVERDLLQENVDTFSDAIKTFEETGQFDLNEDGTFKNEVLETAIKEWEVEHGEMDRDNHALLSHILQTKLDEYKTQISTLEQNIDQWERERRDFEDIERQLDEAERKLNSDDPDVQTQGIQEIKDLDLSAKQRLSTHEAIASTPNEETEIINEELSADVSTMSALKF